MSLKANMWPRMLARPDRGRSDTQTHVPDYNMWNSWYGKGECTVRNPPIEACENSILDIIRKQPDCRKFSRIIDGTYLEKVLGSHKTRGINEGAYTVIVPVDSTEEIGKFMINSTTNCNNPFELLQRHVSSTLVTPVMVQKFWKLDIPAYLYETQTAIHFEMSNGGIVIGNERYQVIDAIPAVNGYIYKIKGLIGHGTRKPLPIDLTTGYAFRQPRQPVVSNERKRVVPYIPPRINYL